MLIIFDSPDKTGKSTLAKMLADTLGIKYLKLNNINVKENESIEDSISISTHSQIETITQLHEKGLLGDAVLDRFHASEFVYSMLFKRPYNIDYIWDIEKRLNKFNDVLLVRCRTSVNKLKHRWEQELLLKKELIYPIKIEYNTFYNKTILPVIEIDTDVSAELSFAYLMKELYKRGIYESHSRNRRVTHTQAMMDIAKTISKRSPDLSRQVGAVLTENGFIVGVGYNGPPSGLTHDEICPRRAAGYGPGEALDMSRAVHAEQNAIMQAGIRFNGNKNLTLFTTDQPCIHCMRMCIQAGVKKIYYIYPYPHKLAVEMADEAGIEMIQYEE